jgi:15-cis-phytoene synthase
MDKALAVESVNVLSYHGRSFRWGGAFLPTTVLNECAVIYSFCRLVDDLADEAESRDEALSALKKVSAELGGEFPRPLIVEFRKMFVGDALKPAFELIEGVINDLNRVRIATNLELLRYCYLVAGTVGLMMCKPLRVEEGSATKHAVSLGIAMQITNICRDVGADRDLDRVYLPANLLKAYGVDQEKLEPEGIKPAVENLLSLADEYYREGRAGFQFIPWRQRLAILVASNLYREIGQEIRRQDYPVLERRVFVKWPRKCWVVFRSVLQFMGLPA